MRRSLVVALVAAVLALAGCSGAARPPDQAAPGVGVNDIDPQPRDNVRDGGDLRWPLDELPTNFNYNQFDGTTGPTLDVIGAVLPMLFTGTADGDLAMNTDYLTSAEVRSRTPQTVAYWINPKATWSDGTPITWRDFEAQWKALGGTDPAFHTSDRSGYRDIVSVRPGTDNKQVVVTFAGTFAGWRSLFSPLYPASTNSDPSVFNTGWVGRLPVTAGPFQVDSVDPVAKTVTVGRSDTWWGRPPKLDRILFKAYDRAALADGLANNEIDFYKIGSSVDLLRRAQGVPGVAIRQSPDRQYNQITFNGAPGAILADPKLRQAVAKGIDRLAIAKRLVGSIVPTVNLDGNHIYPFGSKYYRDNSGVVAFNPVAANQQLDALGWLRLRPTDVRSKAGVPLRLRLLEAAPNPISDQIDRTVLAQLAQIGIQVVITPVPLDQAEEAYRQGNFDLATFAWATTPTPLRSSRGLYAKPDGNDVQQNYGRIYDPRIETLFDQGEAELDEGKRAAIGNQIDQLVWQEVHHLPLYPSTGAYAVRSSLVNFGAPGFADIDYLDAGYLK